jgi:RNA polymerase sigma-70 factor (ECF subfamily)
VDLSDSLLLDAVRKGDEEAFGVLFARYHSGVHGALLRLLGRADEAEDIVQETFVRLLRRPPANGQAHNLGGWLYRVALNLGHNALRSERRRSEREQRAALAVGKDGPVADPAGDLVRREERELVRAAMSALPANYQACLALRYNGLSYAEIAAVLGVAPNAVGTMLARAEKQLKAHYLALTSGSGEEKR